MCGIVGLMATEQPTNAHVQLFQLLMLEAGIRGLHSAGVWSSGQGLVKTCENVYDSISELKPEPSDILLGHNRYSTSGDFHLVENNQPLQLGNLVLAHNGIISMSEDFNQIYGEECVTSNDSELILRKIARHALRTNLGVSAAVSMVELNQIARPIFSCVLVDTKEQAVYLFKDDNRPLHLYFVPSLSCWVWTSTSDIMARACYLHRYEEQDIDPFGVYKLTKHQGNVELVAVVPIIPAKVLNFDNVDTLIKLHRPGTSEAVSRVVDYRLNRNQAFVDYYASILHSWDVDPAYPLMKYLIDRYELSREQQYWMMWLYGVFYHVASVHWVMQEFPDFELVDLDRLQKFHDKHWRLLQYETDRRHEKGLLIDRFKSYKAWVGESTQEARFTSMLTNDPKESYRIINKELGKLAGFGRYALFYYTEALARCVGLPIMCDKIPLRDCDSSRNGLCHAIKREDLVDAKKLSKDDYTYLETEQQRLMDLIQEQHPDLPVDYWFMETAECAFKGLFRRRRYIGYYIDRLYEEIIAIEIKDKQGVTSGVCWSVLEDFRNECLDSRYVNQNGINQKYLHSMLDNGELELLHPAALTEMECIESVTVDGEIKQDREYKLVSAQRKKDTAKSPYLNWKILGCDLSRRIYQAVQNRPVKEAK